MKTSCENAVPLNPAIMQGVKEIEPWGIYEQTAWDIVRTNVEEEERYKLHQKSHLTHGAIRNVYFEYQNRTVKMVMLPVIIAQNNNLHEFFTIFISGTTGIPAGLSIHTMPKFDNVPFYRLVGSSARSEAQDKFCIPLLKFCYQKLADYVIRLHSSREQKKMTELQRRVAAERDVSVIESYYSKKFAREARWEVWKDRVIGWMELLNVNYKSYAEEYEEFVTTKMKHGAQHRSARAADDYYSILGVDRCASEEEIKRSFRVLIMQVHPDCTQWAKGGGVRRSDAMDEERAQKLIEAYQTLRNPEKRTLYDLTLH